MATGSHFLIKPEILQDQPQFFETELLSEKPNSNFMTSFSNLPIPWCVKF